ncbi:radical SAM protein, partial [Candidatus Woesearchaeota archaeon]
MGDEMAGDAVVSFRDVKFFPYEGRVRGVFLRRFEFFVDDRSLRRIGAFRVEDGSLVFSGVARDRAERKVRVILDQEMRHMRSILTKKRVWYLHKGCGVPLIGAGEFGVVDRGTNIIEVKPMTGCNLNCSFCSVDEGKNKKVLDVFIDPDFLAEEACRVAAIKKHRVEFNIGPHGEPLLYPSLVRLVRLLSSCKGGKEGCCAVSMNTNAVLLTTRLVDDLAAAGLSRLNVSLHALDEELARRLYGAPYPLRHVLGMLRYAAKKVDVLLTPVVVPGVNEDAVKEV